jgi:3-oxoacyl-ACP reductase-like protein
MGFFNTILEKLGLKKGDKAAAPAAAPAKPAAAAPVAATPAAPVAAAVKPAAPVTPAAEPTFTATANFHPNAVSEVDVVKHLEQLSAGSGLDWKVSIVDMLKLLGMDSSREARNELAKELGCPADLMSDSAKMNVWLHKEVLKQIAANGGNIPASMLD